MSSIRWSIKGRIHTIRLRTIAMTVSLLILSLPVTGQSDSVDSKTAPGKSVAGTKPAPVQKTKPVSKKDKSDPPQKDEATIKAEAEKKRIALEEFEKKADIKKAEWIEKTMEFGIQKDRKDAINFIPTVKDPEKKKLLENKLVELLDRETDASVLVKAITIAAEIKLTAAVSGIKKQVSNDSEDVRIAAVYALKDLKAVETKNDLIEILKKQDLTVDSIFTEAIIQTLADFEAVELKDFVIEKIKNNKTSRNIRLSLILFLGRSGAKDSKDFLLTTFKDPDEEIDVRSYCVNSLAKLDIKEAIPDINKIVTEYSSYTFNKKKQYNTLYLYSVSALVKLGDQNAYFLLLDAMKNDNATTRLRAIKLLKDLKDKRSIDILTYKMQYDPSAQVQKAARDTLKEMGVDVSKEEPAAKTDPVKGKKPAKKKGKEAEEEPLPDEQVKKRDDF
ncbi:MAG TPA: HEAT repeat domain-containing protein [Spirochaetota bacterium]